MASIPALAIAEGTVNAAPCSADKVRIERTTAGCCAAIQRRPATDRAIGGAVQCRAENRFECAGREPMRLRKEIAGGIVDERVQGASGEDAVEHGLDSVGAADVADFRFDARAEVARERSGPPLRAAPACARRSRGGRQAPERAGPC